MPQFIIHSLSSIDKDGLPQPNSPGQVQSQPSQQTHQDRGHPICLVDCQQIVREPVIAPETCEIVDPRLPPNKQQAKLNEFLRSRKPIKVSELSGEMWHFDEHNADALSILRERNLISIVVVNPNDDSHPQTLELHFNLGFDRFFLVGTPCKLLISGILRVHQPCLDVFFGLNMLQLYENTMIYVNESVIDVHSKIDTFGHVNNRSRLAFNFYGTLPQFDGGPNENSDKNIDAEYIIYFELSKRRRAVALFSGLVMQSPPDVFKPLGDDVVNMYPKKKFGDVVQSKLHMMLVMGEAKVKDRKFILNHPNLATITFTGKAVCHVCGWQQAFFSFSQSSIKIGGYVAMFSPQNNQLVGGRADVVVRSGQALLYIDDHFAILRIDSEDTGFEVEQSLNKQKELKSISLMNINKKRHRPTGTHGYVSHT